MNTEIATYMGIGWAVTLWLLWLAHDRLNSQRRLILCVLDRVNELEIDVEIFAGRFKSFHSMEEAIASLDKEHE